MNCFNNTVYGVIPTSIFKNINNGYLTGQVNSYTTLYETCIRCIFNGIDKGQPKIITTL